MRLTLTLLAALFSGSASATVMERLSLEEMTHTATLVVEGEIISQATSQSRGHIWTDSQVKVTRLHKGPRRAVLTVRQPGGTYAGRGLRVAGIAQLRKGERVLLFLRAAGSLYIPVGMCQGKYRIHRTSDGVYRVRRDLRGATFVVHRQGQAQLAQPPLRAGADPTLTSLLTRLQGALRGGAR